MKLYRNDFIDLVKKNVTDVSAERLEGIALEDQLGDIGIDSLGFATLLFAIEDKLEMRLDESHLDKLSGKSTVADLVSAFRSAGYEIEV